MSHPPLNLTARDFDAYAAEKATSHAFSRPRLEVKQRAMSWARGVVARLAELGIAVDVHGSDEHPSLRNKQRVDCQWVFFWRDQAARDELGRLLERGRSIAAELDDASPYQRHAFLALRVDSAAVEVCFAVHPEAKVDVDNLRVRLQESEDVLTAELMTALRALPEEFAVRLSAEDGFAAGAATPELIRSMLERAAEGQVPLWIGWSIKRDTAVEHSAILDDQLEDAIVALAPIYRLVAWSRDNDQVGLDRRLQSVVEERAKAHAAAEAETEKWRAEKAEAQRRSQEEARARGDDRRALPPRRPTLDSLFAGLPKGSSASSKAAPAPKPAKPPHVKPAPAPPPVALSPVAPPPAAHTVFEKGDRVLVKNGPFAGKVGVMGEPDGKGGVRVMLGLLSAKLDLTDIDPVIEKGERPAIHSSHRKPLATAPRKAH